MNKWKIAILVEGQAEYIFVRDFLCHWYEYDAARVGIECYEFRSDKTNGIPYPFGSRESETFYQIYNVGNDRSVISKMLKEAPRLKNAGFQLIVGVSDMFGDEYHKAVQGRVVDRQVNECFMRVRQEVLATSDYADILRYHFAIMEVEAWFLGMYQFLQRIDKQLTPSLISQKLGIDITKDPEVTYYHPAVILDNIYQLAGKRYGKHCNDVCSITASLEKKDYKRLLDSEKCNSFKMFAQSILRLTGFTEGDMKGL